MEAEIARRVCLIRWRMPEYAAVCRLGWGPADGGGDRKASMLNTLAYALIRCRMQVGDLRMEAEIARRVCNDVKSTNAALVRESRCLGSIKALLRLYSCSIQALFRLYSGSRARMRRWYVRA
jgi:hypothetical protein